MSTISALPASIVTWLQGIVELKSITFMTEFPPHAKAVPLKNSIVSVGISDVTIKDHFTETDGVLVADEYCRTAEIKIALGIHVPASLGGSTCHDVFTKVVDYLTFSSDFKITSSGCGKISSDRNTEALVMTAEINIEAEFCPADETGISVSSFIDKTLFCNTHMHDTSIHITQEEREKWTNSSAGGTYVGTGSATRTISLGFSPKFIAIFPCGDPPFSIDFSTGTTNVFIAFSIANGIGTNGVETTSTGFKLLNGKNYAVNNVIPKTNDSGKTFVYFAVK